jgi:D-amino peptidase
MRKTILLAIATALLAAVGTAQPRGLKVFVSVDMEGISGVVDGEQVRDDAREYATARRWMAEDVNAVVAGLLQAGAGEIVVNDSHGSMRNLSPDDLRPEATLISGSPKPLAMMAGLDGSFDAVVFVGYHAAAGSTAAILDHTISSANVARITVNDVEMPELGLNAAIAGTLGVPVIMLSGDAATCRQAETVLGTGLVTVAVKEAFGRNAARLVPMHEARVLLEDGARTALRQKDRIRPFRLPPPYRFTVSFLTSAKAEPGELVPGVSRTDARTLAFTTEDFLEGFRLLRALIALASTR